MGAVSRLSHTHDQIINWLIVNPDRSLRECADTFGYTQPWLSQLIHSDIFQAELRRRQVDVASRVAASVPEKLHAVADIALAKLADKVSESEDPEFILDAADRALHRMGFAPASTRNPAGSPAMHNVGSLNQTNVFVLGHNDLAEARKIMAAAGSAPQDRLEVVIEGETLSSGLAGPPVSVEGEKV
jgi:hypothetical protein